MLRLLTVYPRRNGKPGELPLPPLTTMARNAVGSGVQIGAGALRGEAVVAPNEVLAQREAICRSNVCGKFRESDSRCSLCGCGLRGLIMNKLRYAAMRCPDNPPHWLECTAPETENNA